MLISNLDLFGQNSRARLKRESIHTSCDKSIKTSSALCEEEYIEKDPKKDEKKNPRKQILSQSIP